jgi:uncharacterized protein
MATVIIEKLDESKIMDRGIHNWPIWEKEVSCFEWTYEGSEECLILEGEVVIETDHGKFTLKKGDFVTFQDGLKCIWDIKKNIKKHYNFI